MKLYKNLTAAGLLAALTLSIAPPGHAEGAKMSDVIASMLTVSTLQPRVFEQRLEGLRAQMTDQQMRPLRSCLGKLYRLGADDLTNPPRPICLNGRCSTRTSPLAELALWSASMSAALDGHPWTRTTSGSIAVTTSQMMEFGCSMMPGLCQNMAPLTAAYVKPVAKVCD